MLTAIVVGVATMAVAFAMIVRIKEFYGTIEDDDITRMDLEMEMES
jgi:multicomponent Na+:H+ antiporter subunit C